MSDSGHERADAEQLDAPDTGTGDQDQTGDGNGNGNREAAKYRTQLRTVEAERDQTMSTLTALQRAEVIRLAGGAQESGNRLEIGEDLLRYLGDDLTGYLTD